MHFQSTLKRSYSYIPPAVPKVSPLQARVQALRQKMPLPDLKQFYPAQLFEKGQTAGGTKTESQFGNRLGNQSESMKNQLIVLAVQLSKVREATQFLVKQNASLRNSLKQSLNDKLELLNEFDKCQPEELSLLRERILTLGEQNAVLIRHLKDFKEFKQDFNKVENYVGQELDRKQNQRELLELKLKQVLEKEFESAEKLMLTTSKYQQASEKLRQLQLKFQQAKQNESKRRQDLYSERARSQQLRRGLEYSQARIDKQINVLREQNMRVQTELSKLTLVYKEETERESQERQELSDLNIREQEALNEIVIRQQKLKQLQNRLTKQNFGLQIAESERRELKQKGERLRADANWLQRETEKRVRELQRKRDELAKANQERRVQAEQIVEQTRKRMRLSIRARRNQMNE